MYLGWERPRFFTSTNYTTYIFGGNNMKKHIAIVGMASLLVLAAGCQDDSAKSDANKSNKGTSEVVNDAEGTAKATSGTATAAKGSEKEEIPYMTPTWTLTKQNATLLKNDAGKLEFVGTTENKNAATYSVVLRLTGDMKDAYLPGLELKFMTNEGETFTVYYRDLASIRMEKGAKYMVFDTEQEIGNSHVIRIDGNLYSSADEDFNTEDFSVDVKPSKKTWELEGTRFPITLNTKMNVTRKNDLGTVKITSFSSDDTSSNTITINGSVNVKEDAEETFYMPILQPQSGFYKVASLSPDKADNFYRSVDTTFSQEVQLDAPLQAGGMEDLYFSVLGETFAYNVRTGKEIKNPNISRMVQGQNGTDETDPNSPNGYVDAGGKIVYNAIEESQATYNKGSGQNSRVAFEYQTGGYKHMSFNIGAAKKAVADAPTYDVVVYGSDFTDEEGKEAKGKILAKKTVTKDTPLEKVDVDVTGQTKVTVFTTTTGEDSIFGHPSPFLPIIVSDVVLSK